MPDPTISTLAFSLLASEQPTVIVSPAGIQTPAVQNTSTLALHGSVPASTISGGVQTFTGGPGTNNGAMLSGISPTVPHIACKITISGLGNGGGAVGAAIIKDINNYVAAYVNTSNGTAYIETWIAGSQFVTSFTSTSSVAVPLQIGLNIINGVARLFYNPNNTGWTQLFAQDVSAVNWRDPVELAKWRCSYVGAPVNTGALAVTDFEIGIPGTQAKREFFPITHKSATNELRNGAPFLTDYNTVLYTVDTVFADQGSGADPNVNTPFCHWGVESWNRYNRTWTQMSAIFFNISGSIYAYQDGALVWDDDRYLWTGVAVSWDTGLSSGDGPVHVVYFESSADLTTGIHIVTPIRTLAVTASGSIYDLKHRYSAVDNLWHITYTYTNTSTGWSATAAAHDTSPDMTMFTNVSTQMPITSTLLEGTCWILVNRTEGWKIGQTNAAGGMQYLDPANLNASSTTINSYNTGATLEPHPNIVALPYTNGGTEFLLGVWGNGTIPSGSSNFAMGSSVMTNDYGNVATAKVFDWGSAANVYNQQQFNASGGVIPFPI